MAIKDYSTFQAIIDAVYELSPLQKKKLEKFLGQQPEGFFQEAEDFFQRYVGYLKAQSISIEYAVGAYLNMCRNMMKSQVYFMKHGKYPVSSASDAYQDVYSNETSMKSYMFGLALSQFLWSTHYAMFSCLKQALRRRTGQINSYLEIGPGHGLFLSTALTTLSSDAKVVAVDISPISMGITKSIIKFFHESAADKTVYHVGDMLDLSLGAKFDFITMGEVIEHVNFPEKLLTKMRDLLAENGRGFISTCVDCPAIDHVFHFHSVEEIREMFGRCGLKIEEERVLPVEDLPMDEIIKRKITINYCAIVSVA